MRRWLLALVVGCGFLPSMVTVTATPADIPSRTHALAKQFREFAVLYADKMQDGDKDAQARALEQRFANPRFVQLVRTHGMKEALLSVAEVLDHVADIKAAPTVTPAVYVEHGGGQEDCNGADWWTWYCQGRGTGGQPYDICGAYRTALDVANILMAATCALAFLDPAPCVAATGTWLAAQAIAASVGC